MALEQEVNNYEPSKVNCNIKPSKLEEVGNLFLLYGASFSAGFILNKYEDENPFDMLLAFMPVMYRIVKIDTSAGYFFKKTIPSALASVFYMAGKFAADAYEKLN
jgi:hypothetical protein